MDVERSNRGVKPLRGELEVDSIVQIRQPNFPVPTRRLCFPRVAGEMDGAHGFRPLFLPLRQLRATCRYGGVGMFHRGVRVGPVAGPQLSLSGLLGVSFGDAASPRQGFGEAFTRCGAGSFIRP